MSETTRMVAASETQSDRSPTPSGSPTAPAISTTSLWVASIVTVVAVLAAAVASVALTRPEDAQTIETARATLLQTAGSDLQASGATAPDGAIDAATAPNAVPGAAPSTETEAAPVAPESDQPTAVPEPTIEPTPAPTATPTPTPTTAPALPLPTPLPTRNPSIFEPVTIPAGRLSIDLDQVVSFELSSSHPARVLDGHTAIYLDETLAGEVDLFVPYATSTRERLVDYDDVINHIVRDPAFARMERSSSFVLDGWLVEGFTGSAPELDLGFYTAPDSFDVPGAGWRFPGRLDLWVVDAPGGPIVVTAETLDADVARADEVQDLLAEVLASLEFG